METPLTSIEQATPEWLTQVLQKKGLLPQGEVQRGQQNLAQTLITSDAAGHRVLRYCSFSNSIVSTSMGSDPSCAPLAARCRQPSFHRSDPGMQEAPFWRRPFKLTRVAVT